MFEYGFEENVDYFYTIDAAKEISMIQGTEKGKEARRYFTSFLSKNSFRQK